MTEPTFPHESVVPDATGDEYEYRSELPVYECEYCGYPLAREEYLALHHGLAHPEALDESEIEAFRTAHEDEEATLRRFRLQALGALLVVYFGLIVVYALV